MNRDLNPPPGAIGGFFDRLFSWFEVMIWATDQYIGCWLRGWFYVWGNGEKPNPDETISSWIGRGQRDGKRAFGFAAAVIDFFMGEGHCRRAIGK
jgi:hypothetical protein